MCVYVYWTCIKVRFKRLDLRFLEIKGKSVRYLSDRLLLHKTLYGHKVSPYGEMSHTAKPGGLLKGPVIKRPLLEAHPMGALVRTKEVEVRFKRLDLRFLETGVLRVIFTKRDPEIPGISGQVV
eukprot:sb/3475770/